jgi:hypothetical protein
MSSLPAATFRKRYVKYLPRNEAVTNCMQSLEKDFQEAGFKPQCKVLADFYESYGLEGDDDEDMDDDDEDMDDDDEDDSEEGSEDEEWG